METYVITEQKYAPLFKAFMEENLDTTFDDNARYIGNVLLNDDGTTEILFCVVLSDWTKGAVEAAAVSDGSGRIVINRQFMRTLYDYVFNFQNKNCMYSLVKESNEKSLKLQKSAGLKQCGILEGFYGPGIDAIIFGITKQQWLDGKWSIPHNKE